VACVCTCVGWVLCFPSIRRQRALFAQKNKKKRLIHHCPYIHTFHRSGSHVSIEKDENLVLAAAVRKLQSFVSPNVFRAQQWVLFESWKRKAPAEPVKFHFRVGRVPCEAKLFGRNPKVSYVAPIPSKRYLHRKFKLTSYIMFCSCEFS
jgi:hypothetical protein